MAIVNGLNMDNLMNVVKSVQENWQSGRTIWKANAKWQSGFKVEASSREFSINMDEPDMLCGTNTAANPVEIVLQAYGACLAIGFAMNAAVKGINIESFEVELEGEIDLPGFLGLEAPEELGMDKLPGFKYINTIIKVKADADADALQALTDHVVGTSPVGTTLTRPVAINTKLEVI